MHVIPGFLGPREIEPLRRICEEVHRQVLVESPAQADAANIAYLTESRYFITRSTSAIRQLALGRANGTAIRSSSRPDMPGRMRIALQAGDACLFHAWGIHRGNYQANVPRQTLDIIYGWGKTCDYAPPPPMCFEDRTLLERLGPGARDFFGTFTRRYAPFWDPPSGSNPRRS